MENIKSLFVEIFIHVENNEIRLRSVIESIFIVVFVVALLVHYHYSPTIKYFFYRFLFEIGLYWFPFVLLYVIKRWYIGIIGVVMYFWVLYIMLDSPINQFLLGLFYLFLIVRMTILTKSLNDLSKQNSELDN